MSFGLLFPTRAWSTVAAVAVALSQLIASAQQPQAAPVQTNDDKVRELLELNNKKHTFEDLLHGDPDAVANTQKIFALSSDPELKQRLAGILLSIGVRDKIYRDYLAHAAREALADETPWPTRYDDSGKPVDWNPVFLQWCQKHELRPWATHNKVYYEVSNPWYYLASSGDPGFYDLFIEGLHSRNLMIVGWAAEGLAKLHDPRAIDPLIAAGRQTPGEGLAGIRNALLYFSDPRAQAAAKEFFLRTGEEKLYERHLLRAKEQGVKGLFPW